MGHLDDFKQSLLGRQQRHEHNATHPRRRGRCSGCPERESANGYDSRWLADRYGRQPFDDRLRPPRRVRQRALRSEFPLRLDHGQHHGLGPERPGRRFDDGGNRREPSRPRLHRPRHRQQRHGNFLYAADFANGKIDVFNSNVRLTAYRQLPFADPTIPTTTGNTYHPFNIQTLGGSIYVTYAKVGTDGKDEAGIGNGFVRRFNTDGVRDLTFGINNGPLNSPWGIVIAPASFGIFGGALLVGNFGEGNPSIHAFNPTTGAFLGTLQNEAGDGIVIDELWALVFGNGGSGGDVNTLYFAAGTAEEEHGLFGKLNPTTASATNLIQFATDEFAISEGNGHIDVAVTRAGDASASSTVDFNTFDQSQAGHASQKSDYQIALTRLTFNPGETSKTVRILIVNDSFVEGDETINLALSNPTGSGSGLGSPNAAELKITDNDTVAPTANPIDDSSFFVRQHYLDFLNREPDTAGFNFWINTIESCGADATCRDLRRINASAAFSFPSNSRRPAWKLI